MPSRLVALDDGPDIALDHTMVVVGRHPACDARLDSLRVSRHHCCMTQENGDVVVRDLGSTNGIRINGQRVEIGRLRPGDELAIAHIRYRLETNRPSEDRRNGASSHDAAPPGSRMPSGPGAAAPSIEDRSAAAEEGENALAAAVRRLLPPAVADKCRIQVIVQMAENDRPAEPPIAAALPAVLFSGISGNLEGAPSPDAPPAALLASPASEQPEACHSDSSH